jgi:hypothetical protein
MPDPGNPLAQLYPQAQQPQSSLLSGDPTRALFALSALNGIRQQQSGFAAGQAVQGAIGPDGNLNVPSALSALAGNPAAAYAAPQTATMLLAAHNAQIQNATESFKLAAAQNGAVQDAIGSMVSDPNLSEGGIISKIVGLGRRTNIPTPILSGLINSIPHTGKQSDLRNWAAGFQNMSIGSAGVAGRVAGPPGPNGEQTQTSLGATTYGPTTTPIGNPLGAEGSSQAYNDALMREAGYGQEIYPMQRALQLVQQLGPGGTGPGAAGRNNFASFVNSITPSALRGWIPGVDPSKIQNFDEFNKYVTQAAQTRAASLGAHTDQQLATTLTANPSSHINDLAVADVLRANIALRNMQRVQTMAAAETGGPLGFNKQSASMAGVLDPRAFLLPMLSQQQRAALAKNLTGAERAKFNKSIDLGIQYGAIDPASLAPPPSATAQGAQ